MSDPTRVLLQIRADAGFSRAILRGVAASVAEGLPWQLRQVDDFDAAAPMIRRWRPHGMLSLLWNERHEALVRRLRMAVVRLSENETTASGPAVLVDETAVAHQAVTFLRERGLSHIAWSGFGRAVYMRTRRLALLAAAEAVGLTCHSKIWGPYTRHSSLSFEFTRQRDIAQWLQALPKPCGIVAVSDQHALTLARVATTVGLRIPDDLLLLGIDDDETICELHHPAISSIRTPGEAIGRQAVTLLEALISGQTPARTCVRLPPTGITERGSTDISLIGGHALGRALRFIDAHACDAIDVDQVASAADISRRQLERLFAEQGIGSPHQRIRRRRCEQAANYLRDTTLPLADIAARCGFSAPQRLITAFRAHFACTPGTYRQTHGN